MAQGRTLPPHLDSLRMENGEHAQYANVHAFREVTLTDNVPVFVLFLLVSTLYSWHHICFDHRLDQVPSGAVPGVGYCL